MAFRLSKKVSLEQGDRVRVSGGPYFLTHAGIKISMGEHGIGVFTGAIESGEGIYVKFDRTSAPKFVYIGPERLSESTGTTLRPHKIVKLRKQ